MERKTLMYIANARIPTEKAHGIQIMNMCDAFAKQGVSVSLVIPRRVNPIKKEPFQFYGIKEKSFSIKRKICIDLLFLPIGKAVSFWLQRISFALHVLFYVMIKKATFYYTRDALIAILVSFIRKNVQYEVHTIPESGLWMHKYAWKRSKKLITISDAIREDIIKLGIEDKKISVARDGVNMELFNEKLSQNESREVLNLPKDQKIVLYSGHLYGWKGARDFAKAVQSLPSDIHAYFVGGTDEDVKKYRKEFSQENIHIVGRRPYSEIPHWLVSSDFLVLPNSAKTKIGSRYTSPLKLFEYMASGTLIISTDVPALKEVLNEETALFCKPDDYKDLASVIDKALSLSPEHRKNIGETAKREVKKYSWNERAKLILVAIV